jgi:hypothetical protein
MATQLPLPLHPAPASVLDGTHAAWQRHQRTSREGAEHVQPSLGDRQQAVLEIIRARRGCTIHEIAVRLGVPDGSASARVRELTLQGRVRDGGTRKRNPHSGVSAIVWVAA